LVLVAGVGGCATTTQPGQATNAGPASTFNTAGDAAQLNPNLPPQ
jgi:hypothetical protein